MQAEIDIHQACANNFGRDSHSGESGESTGERDDGGAGGKGDKFRWRDADFLDLMECSIFLAADVIYSNELTDAFLTQVHHILHSWPPPRKNGKGLGVDRQVYVAIERRCNFTLPECATTSREYDYFMSLVSAGGECHALGGRGGGGQHRIRCDKIDLDFEHHCGAHDRKHMHLYRLSALKV
jgi:hypothetical protein